MLKLPEISREQFSQLMEYIESKKKLLNEENILELLTIADHLEMPELLNDCDRFLATRLSNLELNNNSLSLILSLINIKIISLKASYQKLVIYLEYYLGNAIKQGDEKKIEGISKALKEIP